MRMSKESETAEIRSILVTLGACAQDESVLQSAAELAATLQAELRVLYIQDMGLMRFAELPIAAEVITFTACERRVNRARLEREMEARAKRISRELAQLAEQRQVRWSFKTVRGQGESEILAASEHADLLIVNRKTGRMLVRGDQLGSTADVIVTKSQRTVVLLEEHAHFDRPLVVLVENLERDRKALMIAIRLSHDDRRKLVVLVSAPNQETYQQIKTDTEQWLSGQPRQAGFGWLPKLNTHALANKLWQVGGGVLVVSAQTPLLHNQQFLTALMIALKFPIVLVR
jgi:nucleotide-binding universal stress UspA family protein